MSEKKKGGQKIRINDLFESDEEAPAHPDNEYEIAEGVVAKIKRPTIGLQEQFEELGKELDEMWTKIDEREKAEKKLEAGELTEDDLPEGVTVREFQKRLRRVAAKQSALVLDLSGQSVDEKEMFAPMALVVRTHFFGLSNGITNVGSLSSTGREKETA